MKKNNSKRDKDRDNYLAGMGIKVLRFNSREVLKYTDGVVEVIFRAMEKRLN